MLIEGIVLNEIKHPIKKVVLPFDKNEIGINAAHPHLWKDNTQGQF